jgi:hypothetical protein
MTSETFNNKDLTLASTGLGALKLGSTDASLKAKAPRQLSGMFYGRGAFAPRTAKVALARAIHGA